MGKLKFSGIHAAILLAGLAALAIAYLYMERQLGLAPCPLCIVDRVLLGAMMFIALLALMHRPARFGQRLYGVAQVIVAATGVAVAARHVQLQHLPADEVPGCLPDLSYMLETFTWLETVTTVFNSAGECAQVQWKFLGLSIPEHTLLLFIALLVLAVISLFRVQERAVPTKANAA